MTSAYPSSELRLAPTRYEPKERLAVGGMAEVWRADAVLADGSRRPVAVKRVLPTLADQPLYTSMFEDEARLGMLLRHPNVVRVFDARNVAGTFLLVMELVEGPSLKALLERSERAGRSMPVATALYVVRELSRALRYAHNLIDPTGTPLGIIHRDVSPHNLLLGSDGAVKLTDFGLANSHTNQTETTEAMIGGKLGYLAPEVISQAPADVRLDVFATGIILWELLTGERLFQGENDQDTVQQVLRKPIPKPSSKNPKVSGAVDRLAMQLLERDPQQRMEDAAGIVTELERIIPMVDPKVGPPDVALLVGLYAGQAGHTPEPGQRPQAPSFDEVARELDAFVRIEFESPTNSGAEPLDPTAFGNILPGIRRRK